MARSCSDPYAIKAAANKGQNSEDPDVEVQFDVDPQTYRKQHSFVMTEKLTFRDSKDGKLRIATGLAILKAIQELEHHMADLTLPFAVFHGTGDRVTSYHGSEKLVKLAKSTDKETHLYDGVRLPSPLG